MSNAVLFDAVFESPVGRLGIRMDGERLRALEFVDRRQPLKQPASAQALQMQAALGHYFDDPGSLPAIGLALQGTRFQQRVWQELRHILPGKTKTYGEIAEKIGSSARAVGNACRANPVPIVVPCHRVVAKNGLGGFAGATTGFSVSVKRRLLAHEGVEIPPR